MLAACWGLDRATGLPKGRAVKFIVALALASTVVAVGLVGATAAATRSEEVHAALYTRAATQSCLAGLPNAVAGLPPATPAIPAMLFIYALAGHDLSTGIDITPGPPRQLGVWYGEPKYEGMILSFFKSVGAARSSFKTLAGLYGGTRIRNVVVTWDQTRVPSRSARDTVLDCLRTVVASRRAAKQPPPATLATFAGRWGGHTRLLSISATGVGREETDDGCCTRVYQLTFQVLSVSGTLTRAIAVYRVSSFRPYETGVRTRHPGDVGKLVLKDGIVTNALTSVFFCSDPAWGATGACGA
jgi:hypothetical protein